MNNNYLNKVINSFYEELGSAYLTDITIKSIKKKYQKYYNYIKQEKRKEYQRFIKKYKKINKKKYNKKYISKELKENKKYFDSMTKYGLDYQQRLAVVTDEDSLLIAAGAGSGKTTTMTAKIKYLVERKNIKPSQILCISFTKEATNNIKNKNKNYNIDAYTFHSLGLNIIRKKLNHSPVICSDNTLNVIIDKYFENQIYNNKNILIDTIYYLSCYAFEGNKTLKSSILNTNEVINNKIDLLLANILFLNNIDYKYYKKIYLIKEKKYLNSNIKTINKLLKNKTISNLNYIGIYDILKKDASFQKLKKTILTFINLFKANNYILENYEEFTKKNQKEKDKLKREKEKIFLKLTKQIYIKYEKYLKNNNMIDFNDMINEATDIVIKNGCINQYKYIIVDEYQDTSQTRYELLKAIKDKTQAKLVVVGDDFQSIFRFTGCNLDIFLKFKKYYKDSKILKIENTYRNSQELIDVAGKFIMKNKKQIKKNLKSKKRIKKPIEVYYYNDIIKEIINVLDKIKEGSIYILGRNNNDINLIIDNENLVLDNDRIIYRKNKNLNIKFLTVHKSKGLEADNVIIINLENKILGFPNKIIDDENLKYVLNFKDNILFEEERRLFYVAITRTKNKCYLLVPKKNPSLFIQEIINNKNVKKFD